MLVPANKRRLVVSNMSSDGDDYRDPDSLLSDPDSLLFDAIDRNDSEAVQCALKDGAKINGSRAHAPLFAACERGHDQIVRTLLDAGSVTHDIYSINGKTAVLVACTYGHLTVVQILIDHDSDLLEKPDFRGWTPFLFACYYGHSDICQFLLDRGCNAHVTNPPGYSAFVEAAFQGNVVLLRLLLDADACDWYKRTILHHVAMSGQVDVMLELILPSTNIYPMDKYGRTPFDVAYAEGREHMTNLLVQIYSDRLSQEEDRFALHTLLGTATCFSKRDNDKEFAQDPPRIKIRLGTLAWKDLCSLLRAVDIGFVRIQDDAGRLPIHIAFRINPSLEVLVALVERDPATLHVVDHAGALPLHEFCRRLSDTGDGNSALQWLVNRGGVGTVVARDRDGALPLHVLLCNAFATSNLLFLAVRYLIQCFPGSLGMRTNAGQYPFMIAATHVSSTSLSLVYEIVRANPVVAVPR